MRNKKIWWFLLRFLGTYFFLFLCYSLFLLSTQTKSPEFKSDPITIYVAKNTKWLLNTCNISTEIQQHAKELSIKLLVEKQYVARVIEGCNAVSVIILFIAFIVAFKGSLKHTLLYVFLGSTSIYLVNVIRISLLSYGMLHFEQYKNLLHDLLFPAIIYGYVFFLWLIWVNRFSNLKRIKMKRWMRFLLLIMLFSFLVLVRAYEELFYDPYKDYFKNDYLYLPLPEADCLKLFFSYSLRYIINTIISLVILKVAFPQRSFIKTVAAFYVLAFVLLVSILFGLLIFNIDVGYLFPFYIRRFIINPIFIIVLLPFIYMLRKRFRMNLNNKKS